MFFVPNQVCTTRDKDKGQVSSWNDCKFGCVFQNRNVFTGMNQFAFRNLTVPDERISLMFD